MAEENPVYFKLEYNEAIDSKKSILSTEMALLNLMKILKNYNDLKAEEQKLKSSIYSSMKKLGLTLRKTKASFPFLKIPEGKIKTAMENKEAVKIKRADEDIEFQLREIQRKLNLIK